MGDTSPTDTISEDIADDCELIQVPELDYAGKVKIDEAEIEIATEDIVEACYDDDSFFDSFDREYPDEDKVNDIDRMLQKNETELPKVLTVKRHSIKDLNDFGNATDAKKNLLDPPLEYDESESENINYGFIS